MFRNSKVGLSSIETNQPNLNLDVIKEKHVASPIGSIFDKPKVARPKSNHIPEAPKPKVVVLEEEKPKIKMTKEEKMEHKLYLEALAQPRVLTSKMQSNTDRERNMFSQSSKKIRAPSTNKFVSNVRMSKQIPAKRDQVSES